MGISIGGIDLNNVKGGIKNSIANALGIPLILTTMANLNWSRGYCWYVELFGVPEPFQKGGCICLPCIDVTYDLGGCEEHNWNAGLQTLSAPKGKSSLGQITLNLYDDEKNTMYTFFERWMNSIYNPYRGVLPLDEAIRKIHIQKLKGVRTKLYRSPSNPYNSNLTSSISEFFKNVASGVATAGQNFYVYPITTLQQSLNSSTNEPMTIQVTLRIAHHVDQDFSKPEDNTYATVNKTTDTVTSLLQKASNFI